MAVRYLEIREKNEYVITALLLTIQQVQCINKTKHFCINPWRCR